MVKKYPYLTDIEFLNKIYGLHNQTIYSKITVLDWQERRIADIQGKVISGSVNVNGDSAVRRTASLSVFINNYEELYQNIDSLFNLNKKVFIEIGLKNTIGHLSSYNYPSYPIIWFPFGTFIIQNTSVAHDVTGVTLNLTLGDKMCLLNGEAGGTIPASTNFESYDTLGPDGDMRTEAIRINQIIPEVVNHFGQESLDKIIVTDIPNKIKQVMKWRGNTPLYIWENKNNINSCFYTVGKYSGQEIINPLQWSVKEIIYNYDAGYTYVDFVFPGELACGAGDTVCTVLDKIKEKLGNYEYFYDVFGTFHFQEIKNYVNTSEWRTIWEGTHTSGDPELDKLGYRDHLTNFDHLAFLPYSYNPCLNTAVYDFKNNDFIINYNNSPQYNMIKNDFIVWGTRKSENNMDLPCRYHLAIDERPTMETDYVINRPICFDTSVQDKIRRCYAVNEEQYNSLDELKAAHPVGVVGEYYLVVTTKPYASSIYELYSWVTDIQGYNNKLNNYLNSGTVSSSATTASDQEEGSPAAGYVKMQLATYYGIKMVWDSDQGQLVEEEDYFTVPAATDWRNILYFRDMVASIQGLQTSYYWAEMYNEWPKIYDIENNQWIEGVLDSPSSLDWWLDFIDNDSALTKFSVDAIGRRSYAKVESGCNCVFEPDIPDIVMVNVGDQEGMIDVRTGQTQEELKELGLHPIQVSQAIYDSVTVGGSFNSCYQNVRQLLTDYTDYNESITVNCLPIYHLEPNTRVHFTDIDSGIDGDYIINSISFDLSHSGTMNINAKKVIEKL